MRPVASCKIWCCIVLLVMGLSGYEVQAVETDSFHLVVEDVLGRSGEPVQLNARLVRPSIMGGEVGIGGEQISFRVAERSVGLALTGGDGRAFLEYAAQLCGNQKVNAVVVPSQRVPEVTGMGNLALWKRQSPILFVEGETLMPKGTLFEILLSLIPLPFLEEAWPEPVDDAVSELQKLEEHDYHIVYLFRSIRNGAQSIYPWLLKHGFPMGFTRVLQSGSSDFESLIQTFREGGWDNFKAGIGETKEFAEVLVHHHIRAVILPQTDEVSFPSSATRIKGWKDVQQYL